MLEYGEENTYANSNAAEMTTSEMIRNRFGHDDSASITTTVCNQLSNLYSTIIKPVEKAYGYEKYKTLPLASSYFDSKPLILVIGPKHAGKTTFIRHVLGRNFPGMQIGSENHNRGFTVICHDHAEELIPGQVVVTNEKYHFQDLGNFGRPFLERFNMATSNADIVKDLWFVDSPRIDEKMDKRDKEALIWFASKATRIILLFDPKKLDFTSEMQELINDLSKWQKKFCVVLNKANRLHEMQLVKAYGTLMWNMCLSMRDIAKKEEITVYVSSFSLDGEDYNYKHRCSEMFAKDSKALLDDLYALPKEYTKQKLNIVGRRGKKVMFHAKLMVFLREKLPAYIGRRGAQYDLKDNIKKHLDEAEKRLTVKAGFFRYMEGKKHLLQTDNLGSYKKSNSKQLQKIQAFIQSGIPILLKELQGLSTEIERERDLIRYGLKKGKLKKLKQKEKREKKKIIKKNRKALKDLQRSRAGSGDSMASKGSVFSIVSIKQKVKSVFGGRSVVGDSRNSRAGSQYAAGSIVDDAMSGVHSTGGRQSGRYRKPARQMTRQRQTAASTRSMVERSVADDHIDLFSIVSGEMDDDMFSMRSGATGRTGRTGRRGGGRGPQQSASLNRSPVLSLPVDYQDNPAPLEGMFDNAKDPEPIQRKKGFKRFFRRGG